MSLINSKVIRPQNGSACGPTGVNTRGGEKSRGKTPEKNVGKNESNQKNVGTKGIDCRGSVPDMKFNLQSVVLERIRRSGSYSLSGYVSVVPYASTATARTVRVIALLVGVPSGYRTERCWQTGGTRKQTGPVACTWTAVARWARDSRIMDQIFREFCFNIGSECHRGCSQACVTIWVEI